MYDFLPSIFGYGDSDALEIGLKYLYHSDPSVAAETAGYIRSYYTASELIPALLELEQQRGKNRFIDELLRDLQADPRKR